MKKVNLNHLASWIHRNARELEIAIWKYHFENGNKEDVVNALMYYQNEDGGFGNTVDPDNWNVNSLPMATLFTINILNDIEFYDMQHPIYLGIKRYIDTELNFPEGCAFTVASNKDYPHASYYNYDESYNRTESTGVILGFCTFIIENYVDSKIYQETLALISKMMDNLFSDNLGDMGPSGYISLIKAMKNKQIDGYDYDKLDLRLKELVNNSIQRKPEQWPNYGYRPSDYIKFEDSIFYQDNKDIVNVELDFLHDTLPENDVWPISWSWFENNEKYPKESVIGGNWWKSIKAIERAKFLKNFRRTY
ncbi:hypothetical protein CSC2_37670 [Clostridium zeae]|uniref:Prenyltransferase n=1 Tax=Clostridium zeae TaxID=2759022 RepID=A0ABQ1EEK8_9CLOT|nr:hypothetical protein [Clostridium zeae]GFZ33241.1 hypothetical protein CSC2_37670 [Clostridium zeae]